MRWPVPRNTGWQQGEGKEKLDDVYPQEFGNIVAAACLAHDIGNPPLGHSGEEAIRAWFTGRGSGFPGRLEQSRGRGLPRSSEAITGLPRPWPLAEQDRRGWVTAHLCRSRYLHQVPAAFVHNRLFRLEEGEREKVRIRHRGRDRGSRRLRMAWGLWRRSRAHGLGIR